jgi:SAM-dependent methyltransferase
MAAEDDRAGGPPATSGGTYPSLLREDFSRPSPARMHDYWLGGDYNTAEDRAAGQRTVEMFPQVVEFIREGRSFLRRVVRYLVLECGVRQFLDLGSGIPTVGNVHEVAQAIDPGARVVYVDVDPIAVAHARQILAGNAHTAVVRADLRDVAAVFADPATRQLLDLDEPVGLLLISVLHFLADDPTAILRGYLSRLRPGSYLALSHNTRFDEAATVQLDAMRHYRDVTSLPLVLRSRAEVLAMFDGTDLVDPGLTRVDQWRQDAEALRATPTLCGVGRLR